jgi:hypothetical protein
MNYTIPCGPYQVIALQLWAYGFDLVCWYVVVKTEMESSIYQGSFPYK